MNVLIPILMPHIIEATTSLGIGISNALQGDSSSVSFRIGGKVFSTCDIFNFMGLPIEVRRRIIHIALEDSKGSATYLPPLRFGEGFTPQRFQRIRNQSQLDHEDDSPIFRSRVDLWSANGYPLGAWKWLTVSADWNVFVREVLWRDVELVGPRSYKRFMKLLEKGLPFALVRSITFREGFEDPSDLYVIMAALKRLKKISVLPYFPATWHMDQFRVFPFGLQLVPPVEDLVLGLPLETSTNPASRQRLSSLPLRRLTVTFHLPTVELFEELQSLQPDVELTIRYIPLQRSPDVSTLFCSPLQSFSKVNLFVYLRRPSMLDNNTEDPESTAVLYLARLSSFLETASEEVQERYVVYKVFDWDVEGAVPKPRQIWPEIVNTEVESKVQAKSWERQTDLKLFGGLIGLRLESKKS